jgi:hypothetical protein
MMRLLPFPPSNFFNYINVSFSFRQQINGVINIIHTYIYHLGIMVKGKWPSVCLSLSPQLASTTLKKEEAGIIYIV